MLESLHNFRIELLSLPVRLWTVGGDEVVFGTQRPAYKVKELGNDLLSVLDYDVPGGRKHRPSPPVTRR